MHSLLKVGLRGFSWGTSPAIAILKSSAPLSLVRYLGPGEVCPQNSKRADYTGRWCEKKPRSCKDLAINGAKTSGMHLLYDSQNNLFPVYCDFESEAGYAWALIESFSLANRNQFKDYRFGVDHPVNEDGGMLTGMPINCPCLVHC